MNTTLPSYDFITQRLKPIELRPLPDTPLVSVLVTNYNYAPYIAESIESVLHQTYPHFELVICDDGSKDNSCQIIEEYMQRDQRVKLVRKENGGQVSATMAAYATAQGEIICLLDSDDACYPTRLAKIVAAFKHDPTAGCCVHQMLPVSKSGEPISKPLPDTLDSGWNGPHILCSGLLGQALSTSAISFRRQIAELFFPLPPRFATAYHKKGAPTDAYILGVARLVTAFATLPEVLVRYRFHGSNDGSTLTPTIKSISQILEHMQTVHGFLHEFVESYYGSEIAAYAHLEDSVAYWEHLLAYYVLQHKPQAGVHTYSAETMLTHIPEGRRKHIWRVILALPPVVAEQTFKSWWGMAPWKRIPNPLRRLYAQGQVA